MPRKVYLRLFLSGDQLAGDGRMISRAPEMRLNNPQPHKVSLAKHFNHPRLDTRTLYIIHNLPNCNRRSGIDATGKRGAQTLIAINLKSRIRSGFPMRTVLLKMWHYEIPDPYRKSGEYCNGHYVYLWQVTNAEILGHRE